MEITINLIEAASELAHQAAFEEMLQDSVENGHGIIDENEMLVTYQNGDTNYTDKAQDVFNRWYDYFWNAIEKCKIPEPLPVKNPDYE